MKKVKKEIRTIGIDDSPFKFSDKKTKIVGCVFRGRDRIVDVVSSNITVDGFDSTDKICELVKNSRHIEQIRVLMLDGITFGGLNVVDLDEIHERMGKPVIAVNRKKPSIKDICRAADNTDEGKKRKELIKKAGKVNNVHLKKGEIYYQSRGLKKEVIKDILENTTYSGLLPEPLRVAHLIAKNI